MTILKVRIRLARAAGVFIDRYSLKMSVSGRIYLSFLLTKAALTVARDGRVADLEVAEENFRALLLEASDGMSATDTGPPGAVAP
jgi:hypothetical protein